MGYLYLTIGLVFLGAGLYFIIKNLRGYRKDEKAKSMGKKTIEFWGIGAGLVALGCLSLQLSLHKLAGFKMEPGRVAMALVGAFFFGAFMATLWSSFYLRFYRPDTEEKQLKLFKIGLYASIPLAVISFLLLAEGVAPYLPYPLSCGFAIDGNGFHILTAENASKYSGFSIRWYGVIIVFGALVCYLVSDHKFYQKYGKHGILETTLLVCFPGGILSARIWYVVGNWTREGFANNPAQIFRIWDGGLTILGGAVGGILFGVGFMLLRRKWVDIRFAMDTIVPTILLGQAIGRWGNFFNSEVYGQTVLASNGWSWLPSWISSQMGWDCEAGYIHVPLFLVESMLNIAGYFLIAYVVPAIWKKQRGLGVLSGLYLVWYGIVRIIMEPMRDNKYTMGVNNTWSIWNSMIYIILGVALVATFEILWIVQKGKSWSRGSLEKAIEKGETGEKEVGRKAANKPTSAQIEEAPKMIIEEKQNNEEGER